MGIGLFGLAVLRLYDQKTLFKWKKKAFKRICHSKTNGNNPNWKDKIIPPKRTEKPPWDLDTNSDTS